MKVSIFLLTKRVAPSPLNPLSLHSSWAATRLGQHSETCHVRAATSSQPSWLNALSLTLLCSRQTTTGMGKQLKPGPLPLVAEPQQDQGSPLSPTLSGQLPQPYQASGHGTVYSTALVARGNRFSATRNSSYRNNSFMTEEETIRPNTEVTEEYIPNQSTRQIPRKRP